MTEVVQVPTALIDPNPYQPRQSFDQDGLDQLAAKESEGG